MTKNKLPELSDVDMTGVLEYQIWKAYPVQYLALGKIHYKNELDIRQHRERYGEFEAMVRKYSRMLEEGKKLPPLIVANIDGKDNILLDGYTRTESYEKVGVKYDVPVVVIPTKMSLDEAMNLATVINDQHGKPMDSADKRRVSAELIEKYKWSPEYLAEIYNLPVVVARNAEKTTFPIKEHDNFTGKTVERTVSLPRGAIETTERTHKARVDITAFNEDEKRKAAGINKASTIVSLCTNLHGYLTWAKEKERTKFSLNDSEIKSLKTIYNDIVLLGVAA